MLTNLGIYVHVPFCVSKCAYCNFYSFRSDDETMDRYTAKTEEDIKKRGALIVRPVASIYLGGGTPSLLGGDRIAGIVNCIKETFNVLPDAEITMEANPADNLAETFKAAHEAGVNRISLGVQSADKEELLKLGRRQNNDDVIRTVADAKAAGIDNISVDIMLGLPKQTVKSLDKTVDFLLALEPKHISAYILKVEQGTPFMTSPYKVELPDDDAVADLYEHLCNRLADADFIHYEISNFCKASYHSCHNTHYWKTGEYLGFGPAAHSFYEGKRFYNEDSLEKYLQDEPSIPDGNGGDVFEKVMLGLRLKEGISISEIENEFSVCLDEMKTEAEALQKSGLVSVTDDRISITEKGMAVSNSIICSFLETLED